MADERYNLIVACSGCGKRAQYNFAPVANGSVVESINCLACGATEIITVGEGYLIVPSGLRVWLEPDRSTKLMDNKKAMAWVMYAMEKVHEIQSPPTSWRSSALKKHVARVMGLADDVERLLVEAFEIEADVGRNVLVLPPNRHHPQPVPDPSTDQGGEY